VATLCTGLVQHRACGHRDLVPAIRALPQQAPWQRCGCLASTTWTPETLRPA
jgi:hypothetical protein